MVIATSDELDNIQDDGHHYIERVDEIWKKIRLKRKIPIRTQNPLRAHKPYSYAKAALSAKYVFVCTSRFEGTSRTRTQKPLYAKKTDIGL